MELKGQEDLKTFFNYEYFKIANEFSMLYLNTNLTNHTSQF